ncbi:protein PIN-LIKES 3-like [Amaranthus tricolor]|uniref:protein PIN-LIKES 3-like n=1 Tax=Amaranthus tricolor TaxID=29722 RepID=UPI00258F55F2|nr:protein PIN-LIKES 3-like [Amaranthus tricolor]
MGFLALFMVALMPVLKTLLLTAVGLILALDRINLLGPTARHNLNNLVFYIFSPCLMGAYLAKTVTFDVMVNMWFMPVNILITFIIGSVLGWILVKITKAPHNLQGLVIGCCAAGNLGNLLLIVIPAICNEPKNPFGEYSICMADGAAYVSVSMAVGAVYIWSYVYVIMKISAEKTNRGERTDSHHSVVIIRSCDAASENTEPLLLSKVGETVSKLEKIKNSTFGVVRRMRSINLQMLFAPTTIGSAIGFFVGLVPLLKMLLVGTEAPLRIIYSASEILGGATVPCVTLIVGANLLRGLRRSGISVLLVIGIMVVRYIALPLLGIVIVSAANRYGLVGSNPLYQFVLMLQFALPPAMSIGTIAQLFEAGEGECSVVMLWTYAVSALALTLWSTFFMWLVL